MFLTYITLPITFFFMTVFVEKTNSPAQTVRCSLVQPDCLWVIPVVKYTIYIRKHSKNNIIFTWTQATLPIAFLMWVFVKKTLIPSADLSLFVGSTWLVVGHPCGHIHIVYWKTWKNWSCFLHTHHTSHWVLSPRFRKFTSRPHTHGEFPVSNTTKTWPQGVTVSNGFTPGV